MVVRRVIHLTQMLSWSGRRSDGKDYYRKTWGFCGRNESAVRVVTDESWLDLLGSALCGKNYDKFRNALLRR